ncbi:MAG: DUF4250 domain-containing protein [Muribaculaceae bacterium]|nr:DUF4250 domain-containing protein [Muribaculaceae bacterium]
MHLPEDPNMLVSLVNMKLRDEFPDLADLCLSLGVDEADLKQRLADAGYHYDRNANRFTAV